MLGSRRIPRGIVAMSYTPEELGVIGGAITGLTLVGRGVLKYLENRAVATAKKETGIEDLLIKNGKFAGKLEDTLNRIERHLVDHIADEANNQNKLLLELRTLDGVDAEIQEILRVLRDPTSSVSTEDTDKMLGKVLIQLVGIREALRPRDRD